MGELTVMLPDASFGALLKRWRAARKLSQLDLSLQSDVSQRHLSFLESGRARPSQHMVMQLAEALDVPLRERNTLLQAAGFAPFYRQRGLSDADMAPVQDALTRMLEHHDPYPAVVFDRDFNILMENQAFGGLLDLFGDRTAVWQACCPDGVPNLLRLTFHPLGARPYILNFDEVGAVMLGRAYRETLAQGSDAIRAFIAELRRDPAIPAHWHAGDPGIVPPPVLPLVLGRGGIELRLFTMVSTFGTPHDITTDEIRVELFFPGDPGTEAILRGHA
jgi:transcriptional regulator with XRE-family HTH domain